MILGQPIRFFFTTQLMASWIGLVLVKDIHMIKFKALRIILVTLSWR